MEVPLLLELLAILAFILANGFFSLSEFSVIASRASKLRQYKEEGRPGAEAAEKLHRQPEKFLASVQVGITMLGTLAGVIGGATLVTKFNTFLDTVPVSFIASAATPIAVATVAISITIVSVVLGELVPKYLALSQPESFASRVARPVGLFVRFSAALSSSLSSVSNLIVRLLGFSRTDSRSPVSEEEINLMILEGRKRGIFDATEQKLIRSVFDFADSTVRRAMTPRTDVAGIEINASASEIIDTITQQGYSRYPVYDKSIDKIVGLIYERDILIKRLDSNDLSASALCHKPLFVPDSMPLARLLSEFQKRQYHMAIVLDEYGGTAGIITIEDILEELVGEIRDEYDSETAPLVKHSENVAFADGSVWPGAVNEMLDTRLPDDEAQTLAGLFTTVLGHLPVKNEAAIIADTKITVLEIEKNRLLRMKIEKTGNNSK